MSSIRRINFSGQATDKIREWILTLELQPGERIILAEIGDRLGISRTPVREALRSLIEEGLVVSDGVMYHVRRHSLQDIKNLFAIRRTLEILATEEAAVNIQPTQIQQLKRVLSEYQAALDSEDYEYFISCDLRYHRIISEGSGNDQLVTLLGQYHQQCWWISRYLYSVAPVYATTSTLADHRTVLDALSSHDAQKAREAIEKHLLESENRKIGIFKEYMLLQTDGRKSS
jgi:DNA-binding GntR family transcriptional regulator